MITNTQFRVASRADCKRWADVIFSRMSDWVQCHEFFTYGRAYYVETMASRVPTYHIQARAVNEMLERTLPDLKKLMVGAGGVLQQVKKAPVVSRALLTNNSWCDFGIHICSWPDRYTSQEHMDLEGLSLYPSLLNTRDTIAYSCTLPLLVPERGGGLFLWPDNRCNAQDNFLGEVNNLSCRRRITLNYTPGEMAIFDSFLYHKIEPFEVSIENLWRMTAVIHFLYREEPTPHWEYWF